MLQSLEVYILQSILVIYENFKSIFIILEVSMVFWLFYKKTEKGELCSLKVENVLC